MNTTSSPRRVRGPYRRSRATQEAILDAALAEFAQNGFRKGSMKTVAEKIGMSEAGMLHHFPSKNALLAAVLKRNDDLSGALDVESMGGRRVLEEFIARVGENATRPGVTQLYCVLSAEASDPDHPARDFFVERYRILRGVAREALADMRRSGELREGVTPESGSIAFVAMMDGVQLQWLIEKGEIDMQGEMLDYYRRNLLAEHLDVPAVAASEPTTHA
ncbi:TetR/AcrR family transcriptional regulator [Agromyces luteolus]|nr:TetR/AcrR family transcriptional regulator [Agromyces luteolus]